MLREIVLAAAGATGFGLLFGIHLKKVWLITMNSAAAWYLYLLIGKYSGNEILAMFLVTVLVGLVSGVIAMLIKCPIMVFSIPILIPFIPGAWLYYVMYDIVNQLPKLKADFICLLLQAGAIALGILVSEIGLAIVKALWRLKKV